MATKRSTIKSRKEEIRARKKRNRFNPLQAELDKPLSKSLKEGLAVGATLAGPGKFLKVGKVFKRGDTAKKAGKRTAATRKAAKAKGKEAADKRFKAIQAEGKARKRTGSQPRGTFGPKSDRLPLSGVPKPSAVRKPKFPDTDLRRNPRSRTADPRDFRNLPPKPPSKPLAKVAQEAKRTAANKKVLSNLRKEKGVRQPNFRKAGTDKRARENLQKRGEERLAKRPAVVERSAKSQAKNPNVSIIKDVGSGKTTIHTARKGITKPKDLTAAERKMVKRLKERRAGERGVRQPKARGAKPRRPGGGSTFK